MSRHLNFQFGWEIATKAAQIALEKLEISVLLHLQKIESQCNSWFIDQKSLNILNIFLRATASWRATADLPSANPQALLSVILVLDPWRSTKLNA